MPNLVAQGPQPEHRWSRVLSAGLRQVIGREIGWPTPWDDRISRKHLEILYRDGKLEVVAVRGAKNPVFYKGEANDSFSLSPGEHFIVGRTTFVLVDDQLAITRDVPRPRLERKFAPEELRRRPFRDPQRRLDQLARLPMTVDKATTDHELRTRLLGLVMAGVSRAQAVAIVKVCADFDAEDPIHAPSLLVARGDGESPVAESFCCPVGDAAPCSPTAGTTEILNSDLRGEHGAEFPISERLIFESFRSGASVVHAWEGMSTSTDYTFREGLDWAFCVPWSARGADRWALYVAGTFNQSASAEAAQDLDSLSDDLKFVQILISFASTLLDLQLLKIRQVILDRFVSPRVRDALQQSAHHADLNERLAPREASVSVMFCDLRGFSSQAEAASADELRALLEQVSRSLGIMTTAIIDNDGVVSDFQGDAAMGFWGWPNPQDDAILRACVAALAVRRQMGIQGRKIGDSEVPFSAGIGIASGKALAGIIGTVAQGKIGVFGPVVNLAARLETMTKQLKSPVVVDQATARAVLEHNQQRTAQQKPCEMRVRRLGKVRPAGLKQVFEIFELLPAESADELSNLQLQRFTAALSHFENGQWREACDGFSALVQRDPVARFFFSHVMQHNETPPDAWDGVVRLDRK